MIKELTKSVLRNPIRLGIMIYLLTREKALFKEIQNVLELTPGNLDSHLKILEKEGLIKLKKVIADRPRTLIVLTDKGIKETKRYLKLLEDLIKLQ